MVLVLVKLVLAFPHELLHWLALRLAGRRPLRVHLDRVILPPGLTDGQRLFVLLLPALTFTLLALLAGWAWGGTRAGWLVYAYSLAQVAGAAYDYIAAGAVLRRLLVAARE
jgi:hypothetical protein